MSTTPLVLQTSLPLTSILNYFNTYAVIAAATIKQEQADIAAGDHVSAVNDAVAGAAASLATAVPAQAANVQAGFQLFALGETLVRSIVSMFHHSKAATPAPAA